MKSLLINVQNLKNEGYQYVAKDYNGQIFAYSERPIRGKIFWRTLSGKTKPLGRSVQGNLGWSGSLFDLALLNKTVETINFDILSDHMKDNMIELFDKEMEIIHAIPNNTQS